MRVGLGSGASMLLLLLPWLAAALSRIGAVGPHLDFVGGMGAQLRGVGPPLLVGVSKVVGGGERKRFCWPGPLVCGVGLSLSALALGRGGTGVRREDVVVEL